MALVLAVDDSPSMRAAVAGRLRAEGHTVEEAADAETAVERATACRPDLVVTDLVMPGLSGVQLCRLLRTEPSTAHVPVVLLTTSGDKRSRFWARSAGAAAYVGKNRIDDLVRLVPELVAAGAGSRSEPPLAPDRTASRLSGRLTLQRISRILDVALFDSVLAGEVRALASTGELGRFYEGLVGLLSGVLTYRWLAIAPARPNAPALVHVPPGARAACEDEIRRALGLDRGREVHVVEDERAAEVEGATPEVADIAFGGQAVGRIAIAADGRPLAGEDRRNFELVGEELGGPLQMTLLYEDARRLACVDGLTGLLNRRAFIDAVERERARSDRAALPLSLLLLDVDHFKRVNDGHGHAVGDAALLAVARALVAVARRSDVVGRWGGEEFVIALPETGEAGARVAAERVRRAVAAAPLDVGGGELLQLTVSVGVASAYPPWSLDALTAAADEAMYAAKARGRNRVEATAAIEPSTGVRFTRPARLHR